MKVLTGEERVDALCKSLQETHGFTFPESVYGPKHKKDRAKAGEEQEQPEPEPESWSDTHPSVAASDVLPPMPDDEE